MAPLVTHKKVMNNGKFLLVMVYPKENSLNQNNPLNEIYPKSGLYRNDGGREPIWTLPGPFEGQVFLSADGDFLANIVFASDCNGDGVCVYHKGKLLRAHKITDLTRADSVQEACPACIWHGKVDFNEADETFVLEANDGRVWRFDLRTGEAVTERQIAPVRGAGAGIGIWWIVGIIAALVVALLLIALGGLLWCWTVLAAKSQAAAPGPTTASQTGAVPKG